MAGKKLRLFSLAGADQLSVQMVTAVLLQCIQGAAPLQPLATVQADPKAAGSHAADSHKAAALWTSYFWQELLKRSASAKSQVTTRPEKKLQQRGTWQSRVDVRGWVCVHSATGCTAVLSHNPSPSQEIRFVDLLGNLVVDILAVINQPEWPAAQMIVEGLCVQLIGTHGLQSTAAATRTVATELLGRVLIHFRKQVGNA